MILDYLGGPSVLTGSFKGSRSDEIRVMHIEDSGRGTSQGPQETLQARKGKKLGSPLKPAGGTSPTDPLILT